MTERRLPELQIGHNATAAAPFGKRMIHRGA